MDERLRPVSIALLIGLITFVFGILWAVVLVTQHERIHGIFVESLESRKVSSGAGSGSTMAFAREGAEGGGGKMEMEMENPPQEEHENPLIEEAHERLTRGHIHWMGLGLVTIAVSLLLAFLNSPPGVKTVASLLTAVGGFFYPLNWIIMGFRTPSLGSEAAQDSVMFTAGPTIFFVLAGVLITIYCLLRGISQKR
ncbi:MAG: hypothetical protein HY883_04485 [Deltaproteobacteria bacterium]|nr:hypothetical protein [Deltaproteobacteria bacterium]